MKKLIKWIAFLFVVALSAITFSSCNIQGEENSHMLLGAASQYSETVKCPYTTVTVADSYRFTADSSVVTNQSDVNTIYDMMQPGKWSKVEDDPNMPMEALTLYFNNSDVDRYVYKIYNDGFIFYVHNVKSAKAERLPNGTIVQGEYAYYKIPENVYQDLNNYFQSKYGNNS